MAAKVLSDLSVVRLDRSAEPDERVTEKDVQDASKLARLLMRLLRDVSSLRRKFAPRRIDFEDVAVGEAGASVSLHHGFGGRVRWWPCDWVSPPSYTAPDGTVPTSGLTPALSKDDSASDGDTLVLRSWAVGTVTVRVEEAG